MSHFLALQNFINQKFGQGEGSICLHGLGESQWHFIQKQMGLLASGGRQLFIFESQEKAEYYHDQLTQKSQGKALLYPGLDASPYGGHIHSDFSLFERFKSLYALSLTHGEQEISVFTSIDALGLLTAQPDFFVRYRMELEVSDIIAPQELAQRLVALGYRPCISTEERGTFSSKGEIFDIYPLYGVPVRIHFFDEMVEEIFTIDLETQRTQRKCSHQSISLGPAPPLFGDVSFATTLRGRIPRFGTGQKIKELAREEVLHKLAQGNLFESYSLYAPFFFNRKDLATLLDYFDPQKDLVHIFNADECERASFALMEQLREEYEMASQDNENPCLSSEPEQFYSFKDKKPWEKFRTIQIDSFSSAVNLEQSESHASLALESSIVCLKKMFPEAFKSQTHLKSIVQALLKYCGQNKKALIVFTHDSSRKEIEHLLNVAIRATESFSLHTYSPPEFHFGFLEKGFYYLLGDILVLSESDFFRTKRQKTLSKVSTNNADLFAEQISSLKIDDYVVHKEYGIGIYKGLQSMDIGGNKNDFLIIHYQDKDKVYVPVYKIGLVQKYADASTKTKVANLKNNKFDQAKKRAKESAKKLAFDLIKIQAEREAHQSYCFSPPDDLFREFELQFPFKETVDQISAIEDTLSDMQRPKAMDRLICGDVGFGKTEIAMRAAFKAVEDKKQVAILVPTTILALQHFRSFQKRFESFPVEIDFISRFKSTKESNELIKKANNGQIDILIGTHKILSNKLTFKNLGLLIIDEEQRFGVSHKEKLKALKNSIDILTLTATPIPRTLQLAFLGIRDLSLIQTAPPKRQSIKTYIIRSNDDAVRKAIQNELKRGGQIFFVHNRVQDIQRVAEYIRDLVPSIKMVIAHGQIAEKELESRMSDFYNHKYDLLLSTTIIESGLDISSANTMIIDRADTYGLAQLHQLRGRIGRSERKAYAYFLIPNNHKISETAFQRLQSLQTYTDIGSGFSIASSDLEIRGAGDILGAEQSGHIEAVGLEVYMELLKEAIHELKGEEQDPPQNIEIQTPFSCFIPNSYITDGKERLKTYKRLANIDREDTLESIREELQDRFGIIPNELDQLFQLLSVQIALRPLGIKKVKMAEKMIELKFSKEYLEGRREYRDKIVHFFSSRPKKYKFGAEYSVTRVFSSAIDLQALLQFSQDIAQQIITC